MATYTTSLRLTQPTDGDTNWGATVNNGITALVDSAVAGTASITMTAANYTLSNTNGAADEARCMFLSLGGTPGASYNVVCPAVSKLYLVTNNTGYSQTLKTPAGTGVSIPTGVSMVLYCNGTNVVSAFNYMASPTVESPTITNGYTEETATANTGTAYTINLDNGSLQSLTLTGNCIFTFPTPTAGKSFMLLLKQDGVGSRTATWPGTVKWPGAVSPVLTTTASKTDKFVFTADGTSWLGSNGGQNY